MMPTQELTAHEKKVMQLILNTLEGNIQGFPDSERKLRNVAKAWARFISLEPWHFSLNPEYARHLTPEQIEEEAKPSKWREGIVPGEWLMAQISDTCEWMPAPVIAREIYCSGGFKPADGRSPDQASIGRRHAEIEERSPLEMLDV